MLEFYFELVSWTSGFKILGEALSESSAFIANRSLTKGGVSSIYVYIRLRTCKVTMNWTVKTAVVREFIKQQITMKQRLMHKYQKLFIT